MIIDDTTAQLTSSILMAAIATHLMVTTVLQYDTRASRIISVAYVTVTGTGFLTASLPGDGTEPVLGAIAAGGITLSFGLLRSGLRLQQLGRSPQLNLTLGATAITTASGTLAPLDHDHLIPLGLSVVFSAAFAGAAVRDSVRGPSAERPSARMLQAVMALVAAAIVVASTLILTGTFDWDGGVDAGIAIGTGTAFSLVALCVTSMRADDVRTTWWGDDARGQMADFELANAAVFRRDAVDRIERSTAAGAAVGLVWIEIDQLDDVDQVYGPVVRDRAIVHVGRVLRTHVPPFALLAHLGNGRFAVLTTARARRPVERVASAIRTGLDHRPDDLPLLVVCRIGTSVAGPGPANLDQLLADAQARSREAAAEELEAPDPS